MRSWVWCYQRDQDIWSRRRVELDTDLGSRVVHEHRDGGQRLGVLIPLDKMNQDAIHDVRERTIAQWRVGHTASLDLAGVSCQRSSVAFLLSCERGRGAERGG